MDELANLPLLTGNAVGQRLSLESLGAAYILLLGSCVMTVIAFVAARRLFVVTPNRDAQHYGLYVTAVLTALMVAATLENQFVTWQTTAISYALFPQLLILASIHFLIYQDRQPWLITLGASAIAGTIVAAVPLVIRESNVQPVHWAALGLLIALLAYLCYHAVSTRSGFLKARSIYVDSHETKTQIIKPQRPWLGLPQWVALAIASIALSMFNATLQGNGIGSVPAMSVFIQSIVILSITIGVCTIPAGTYWLAHKHWMPELTRFVWLVWLVVGFAFSYGNFLSHLRPF